MAVYLLMVVSLNLGVSGSPCTTDRPNPYKANMARETAETMAKDRVLNSCNSTMVKRVPKIAQYATRCFVFSAGFCRRSRTMGAEGREGNVSVPYCWIFRDNSIVGKRFMPETLQGQRGICCNTAAFRRLLPVHKVYLSPPGLMRTRG